MKKRYKILSIILALAIVIGTVVTISIVSSSAESFTDENGIEWTVTENYPGWAIKPTDRNSISGHVKIPSEYNGAPINMIGPSSAFINCTELTSIEIPDSVTNIGHSAFQSCTGLTSVKMSNNIKTIDNSAFRNCTGLTSIEIPNGVKSIITSAFQNCTSLTSVDIPDSVTSIAGYVFTGCTSLASIKLSNSIDTIDANTFCDCTSLTSIEIPNSVKSIKTSAFKNCTSLTSIKIPEGVVSVETYVFDGCTNLADISVPTTLISNINTNAFTNTAWYNNQPEGVLCLGHICFGYKGTKPTGSLTIPRGITVINDDAFYGCSSLTSIEIPDTVTYIGEYAFYKCTGLTSVDIPDSVTSTDYYVFSGCTKLTNVTLSNNLEVINVGMFKDCTSLKDITIPSSVNNISGSAFENCTSLTSIVIPDSVTKINGNAFKGCTKLANITLPNGCDCANTSFLNTAWYNAQTSNLLILDNTLMGYKGDKPTGELIIPEGVTIISANAFSNCTGITSVQIPDSVTSIGNGAFRNCTGLTSIEIPNSVITVGGDAFYGCSNLTSIVIPDSVTYIGQHAFKDCTSVSNLKLGTSVQTIDDGAFSGCTGITSVNIPNSVNTIGDSAFGHCSGITSVKIGNNVKSIGDSAFIYCRNIKVLDLGASVETIGSQAFLNNNSLTSIDIPDSVTTIKGSAFYKCSKVDNISLPSSLTTVETIAFAECGLIKNLELNCDLSVLASDTFLYDEFENVVLGSSIDSIGDEFSNMNELDTITIPSSVTNIKDTAFVGSNNVTIITPANSTAHKFATSNNIPVEPLYPVEANKTINFEVTCDKLGYEFTVYRVANLESGTDPFEIRYDSLIADIEDEIFEGDSSAMLAELDKLDSTSLTEVVGIYSTDVDGSSKIFADLPAGIYYVRATNFPANVYGVQNSVFALPYFNKETNWWIYEIDPIPLATKVDESNPEIVKSITNSTKDNVNFTDVSLGDTVNFEIEASRVGSANVVESKDFKLNSYVISDIMEAGLTLNQDSFVVTLEDIDGNTIATLENTTDYIVNIVATEGVDTTFTVSLTPEYLKETEFYSSANVVIAYSAVLNEYSTREFDGNYNTATDLTYSNKTNVTSTVEGNTVYAYTFGLEVNKYDDAGTPLAGSQFALYLTEDDAKAMKNEIATGISTDTGKVEFFTEGEDVIRLSSGTYYIVETKATENYNRYTDVIPVAITVEYGETEVNGTYIESAPENGVQLVEVRNSKVIIPNTGGDGALYRYLIAAAFAMLAVTFVVLKKRNSKKVTAK